ncbi:DUF6192 family protein [Streptomyces sp. NPDC004721]
MPCPARAWGVKTVSEESERVGAVSRFRYDEIVTELRQVLEQQAQGQFTIGDRALEIEPMRLPDDGAAPPGRDLFSVRQTLARLAEDIGLCHSTVVNVRWTAARWPKKYRRAGVSFTVHRVLGSIPDEAERFAAIKTLPVGKSRWTVDDARRRVGRQVANPVSPEEKITAIHSLARAEEVAAAVTSDFLKRPTVAAKVSEQEKVRVVEELTRDESVATTAVTGLLRRPDVAFKAMADDAARFQVNQAQNERSRQAREDEVADRTSPMAPAVRHIDRTVEFLDLVTSCHACVAAANRTVSGLPDCTLSEDERTIVHASVAKVRGVLTELKLELSQVSDLLGGVG